MHIADQVAAHIERLIVNSVLKVGQLLPSERRLMDKLGCSRTALREGLRILRGKGVIRTEHGKGSYVQPIDALGDAGPLMHLFSSQPRTLFDLLEVRVLLEAEAARLAAMRATSADLIMIRRQYAAWQHAQGNPASTATANEHARRDHAFHRAINEASHNPVLVHMLESLSELMLSTVYASVRHLYVRPETKASIDAQHAALFEAIEARNPQSAQFAARAHVVGVRESLRELELEDERIVRADMRLNGWD
ncbi:transcriptional regulator GlcC [Lampropedia puyangensis]|uniref:Transcriptional regulator GlcC n=1 Tax=Lampropedia puyangensis TaxID=1330072 RepID=A0A4S8F6X2_9BURK|nr:transcriptional regulator GlcC [Lampropedia puyangensis]THU01092.1 transcriptional regulator GlcC [Lampropedia puyangensis]